MGKLKKNLPIAILLLAIGICMFILNIATLISPDDYSYAISVGGDDLKVTSITEIINASRYLYLSWTGRILPHLLVGIFMTTSTIVFKILNTIMFLILLILSSKFITRKTSYLSIIAGFGFLVYGTMFGEKFAWISGSLNYLWTTVALFSYLYVFYGYFIENIELKKWQKIAITISGIIVGSLHEVTAFVGGAFLGILFLANIKKVWKSENKGKRLFFIGSIVLFAIGCFITIFAPGNFVRSETDPTEKGTIFSCLGNYKDIKWQLIITLVLSIIVCILKEFKLIKKELIYFVLPCIIATIPFAILGYFTPRCFVPYEMLIIIIASTNIQYICEYFKENKYYKKALVIISCIVTIIVFVRFLPSIYGAGRYILPYKIKMTKQLEEAKSNEEKDVVVSKFLFTDKMERDKMINPDNFFLETASNAVVNTYMALYYNFDLIYAISDIDYLIEIDTDLTEPVDYGILNKDTLELISVVNASDKIIFTIPKEQLGTYVVDCRDKELRSHIKSVRIRAVGEEIENPDIEQLINQEE